MQNRARVLASRERIDYAADTPATAIKPARQAVGQPPLILDHLESTEDLLYLF